MSVTVQGRVPKVWGDATVSHLTRRLQALERALASGADHYSAPSVPSFGSGTITGGAGAGIPSTPPPAGPVPPPVVTEEIQIVGSNPHTHLPHELLQLSEEIRRLAETKPHTHGLHEIPSLLEEARKVVETKPHTHSLDDIHGDADDAQRVIAGQMFGG